MKRTWIGAGLLALLLTAGLLVGEAMEARVSPGAGKLRSAAEAALSEDWDTARTLAASARADWHRLEPLAQILAPHEEVEQVTVSFAQLSAYEGVDGPAYNALCMALASQLEALGKAHRGSLSNLL